jgi:DNA/RNA-binding domain of Phe-tRNA-synthetase-like protein
METSEVMIATDAWKAAFPGAVAGALVMRGVQNPQQSAALEARKRRLEERLRAHDGIDSEPIFRAYADYYRAHGKTYHLKGQWESVAVKGKAIPTRAALVEAMFMAELENLILTAGHDLAAIALPVRVDVTGDDARYAGDMMMVDGRGIISSVLHGPDRASRITPETRDVLFAVYAPAGIGENAVRDHLEDIRANVAVVAPEAETVLMTTLTAA